MSKIFVFKDSSKSKWQMTAYRFAILVSVINTIIFFQPIFDVIRLDLSFTVKYTWLICISLFLISFVITFIFTSFITLFNQILSKIILATLTLINSLTLYIYNVESNMDFINEEFGLHYFNNYSFINIKACLFIFVLGILPAFLILKVKIDPIKKIQYITQFITAISFVGAVLFVFSPSTVWMTKHSSELKKSILPWSYIATIFDNNKKQYLDPKLVKKLSDAKPLSKSEIVVVLVIGESARAKNFELYGYERSTNSRLKELNINALQNTKSCATNTKDSVHCMLSVDGLKNSQYELLPSYLTRNNIDVWWHTNNAYIPNFKGVNIKTAQQLKGECKSFACQTDEILMRNVLENIDSSNANKSLVVLHQKGSEGPEYFNNYPKFFEQFQPVCEKSEIYNCTEQSLINTYDNTIYYNDFVLSSVIDQLKAIENKEIVMIYISDHGESLGESGLYLHSIPKLIAPTTQTDIPFLIWMSESFRKNKGFSFKKFEENEYSHANIFHSVLGALEIQSEEYDANLDVFNQSK